MALSISASTDQPVIVNVLAGTITGTNLRLANDIAAVLDGTDFRICPIIGKGSLQSASDLLGMPQIDVAFLQSNVIDLEQVKRKHLDIGQRVRVIAKMFNEEVHLVTKTDIASVDDLSGMRVNLGPSTSGGHATSRQIFRALGIEIDVHDIAQVDALDALRDGRIDALCRVVGSPVGDLQAVIPGEGLHLLPLPVERIGGAYLPVALTADDYPGLISGGQPTTTAAAASLLAARQPQDMLGRQKIDAFSARLKSALGRLNGDGYHSKWAEATFDINIPGWQTYEGDAL